MEEYSFQKSSQIRKKIKKIFARNALINRHTINKVGLNRIFTANSRVLPNFLILGAHKAGSSSLYLNLIKHPDVLPALTKEIMYFDAYYGSTTWYRANFPLKKEYDEIVAKSGICRIGEATPQYLFHPLAPRRVKNLLPNAKFLVVLRNPIDRAFSHYNHNVRKKIEPLSFQQALEERQDSLKKAREMTLDEDIEASRYYERYSYLDKGKYAQQLESWFKIFPKEQFFIFKTDDFVPETWLEIYKFLDLSNFELGKDEKFSVGKYQPMEESSRKWLREYFKPYNEKLSKMLNIELDWN